MPFFSFENLFKVSPRMRWAIIVVTFVLIAVFDFSTPPEYVPAYLYAFPILVSVSFLRPGIAKILLALAVAATLLNMVIPQPVLHIPSVLFNRSLAAISILISAFFMLRYIEYQEQIQIQERLLETERNLAKVREDLIATLTHDLKTPLLGEQKTLHYFQDGTFGPLTEEQQEVLGALQRTNERQLALVENLLDVYRNDNLGVDVQMTLVNMDDLIADVLTELQYLAHERRIQLDYICQQSPPPIRGEELQLKRVLSNVIHNALNYTPTGGKITVRLGQDSNQIRVEIQDTGPGLSSQDLENVFHRFYRSDGDRQVIGTGLGLYLSRQIIQAHQGRIWAESAQPNGCLFIFTLPAAREKVTA
ncbi:MAG TPA: HAMP domain-containing sensor histidine kinase [Coleofasciculaceae cyanobacterium]